MDDKLKKINESQKNRIIIILNVGKGGGGAKLQSVLARMVSPGGVRPETVLVLCIHIFSAGFGQFFKYVFDN